MRLLIGIGVLLVASTLPAQDATGFYTGNDLKRWCDMGSKWCDGYVLGAADDMFLEQQQVGRKKFICIPNRTEAGQIVDLVKRYLDAHPDQRQWPAPALVSNAMNEAYSCEKKR